MLMKTPPIPENEAARALALGSYGILDTPADPSFDALTALAAFMLNVPIALVSLVDGKRQWFKSRCGVSVSETSREISFCGHVVAAGQPLIINDTLLDERFADNPLVLSSPSIRFYAGFPLRTAEGLTLGTLCVVDLIPRKLDAEQERMLALLAEVVMAQLESHRDRRALQAQRAELELHAEISRSTELELRQLTTVAERASLAKTEFLANMSHEIRTPMNAIIGLGELLLETELTPKQRKYVANSRSAGEHLLRLIDDILDVAKVEAGKLELEVAPFTLQTLVRSIEQLMLPRVTETGVKLLCDVASNAVGVVLGDMGRLRQVLLNLVGNAFKFTSAGRILLQVTRLSSDEYEFAVSDTGVGIAPERQSAIFQSFTQADNATTRSYGGTGLGLTISQALVALMGGHIWVQSAPGQGSTFRFTARLAMGVTASELPAAPQSDQELSLLQRLSLAPPNSLARTELRLLVADDVSFNRELVSAFLERFPWRIDFASDGADAVEQCRNIDYDLVLMDIQMPGTDGYEATRLIRSMELSSGRRRAPIVAFTAHAMGAEVTHCLAAGCDGHLAKPITRLSLVAIVAAFARRKICAPHAVLPEAAILSPGASRAASDDEIAHLVPEYLADCARRVAEVRGAARRGELEEVAAQAHTLRGTGSSFGFPQITASAAKLENAVAARDLEWIEREAAALQIYLET
jgi:two-component system, sensor histidine kinase